MFDSEILLGYAAFASQDLTDSPLDNRNPASFSPVPSRISLESGAVATSIDSSMSNPTAIALCPQLKSASSTADKLTGFEADTALIYSELAIDLRADTNRDGVVSFSDPGDDLNETTWDSNQGAILLPNLDDDSGIWKQVADTLSLVPSAGNDEILETLNDAYDDQVNGELDKQDLAPLAIAPWQDAPDDATVRIFADERSSDYVRLFVERESDLSKDGYVSLGSDGVLSVDELREGAKLWLEAKDIVRDSEVWDGYVTLTLEVTTGEKTYTDEVKMRVSPLLFENHLMPVKKVYVDRASEYISQSFADYYSDIPLEDLAFFSSKAAWEKSYQTQREGAEAFYADLELALQAGDSPTPLEFIEDAERYIQDLYESTYVSMPKSGGDQQTISIFLRSAIDYRDSSGLVVDNRFVFDLRGEDIGAVQQYDLDWVASEDFLTSATGNFETIPPHTVNGKSYPNGRILYGSAERKPDPSFIKMLESQGYQDPIVLDVPSWLRIGHVDEVISFLPAPNERGWVLVVASPEKAYDILQDASDRGYGDRLLFEGKLRFDEETDTLVSAEQTVDAMLVSEEYRRFNALAQQKLDEYVAIFKQEVGLTDAEIVELPSFFGRSSYDAPEPGWALGSDTVAEVPGVVNSLVVGNKFIAPKQHGPMVDGKDLFQQQVEDTLAPLGIDTYWVEGWYYAHFAEGEIHCVTNVRRDPSASLPWWETAKPTS